MEEQATLEECLRLLSTRRTTHPHLTAIWTNYLTQHGTNPTPRDLRDCLVALGNMDTICDIDPAQLPAIYGIFTFLSS